MSRTYRALTTLALSVALAATAATAALAAPPTGSTEDVHATRKALYQSELAQNLAWQAARSQAARTEAAVERGRALERQAGAVPTQPVVTIAAPQPIPAAPGRDVNVVAIALLGLAGGLIGGGAVVAGAAANRRRHRVVAA
jgi:hypothetical protein